VNDIEVEGMRRARVAARDAHIIVGVVDASDCMRSFEAVKELIDGSSSELVEEEDVDDNSVVSKNILYVMNKIDLMKDSGKFSGMPTSFGISCATGEGVENFLCSLSEKALSMVSNDDDNSSDPTKSILSVDGTEGAVITRARHRRHVKAASEALGRFERLSDQGYMALDLAAEELRLAASELGRVTGAIDVENILDVLFADFCIGK
jgi:tRNA modification GTPase